MSPRVCRSWQDVKKLGKTWLAIDSAVAVATGGYAMGSIPCEQGDVLYVDMENGQRRIQRRIATLFPDECNRPDLSRYRGLTSRSCRMPALSRPWNIGEYPSKSPRLVVVDVFQRIKPAGNGRQNAYESDYSIVSPLQKWATEHGIAVSFYHHTRKGGATIRWKRLRIERPVSIATRHYSGPR